VLETETLRNPRLMWRLRIALKFQNLNCLEMQPPE